MSNPIAPVSSLEAMNDVLLLRKYSIWMICWGLTPIGLLPMSVVAETIGTPVAMVIGGLMSIGVVLVVMVWGHELWTVDVERISDELAEHRNTAG